MNIKKVLEEYADVFEYWERKDATKIVLFCVLTAPHVSNSTDIPVGDIGIKCSCRIGRDYITESYTRKQRHEKQRWRKRNTQQEENE